MIYLKTILKAIIIIGLLAILLHSCSKENMNSITTYVGNRSGINGIGYTIEIKGQEIYLYEGYNTSGSRWDMEKVGTKYQSKDPRYKDTYYFTFENDRKNINLRFGNYWFYGEKR